MRRLTHYYLLTVGFLVVVMTVSFGLVLATAWLSSDPCVSDWDVACSSGSASILENVQWWAGTVPLVLALRIAAPPLLLAGLPLGLYWLAAYARSHPTVVLDERQSPASQPTQR